MFDIQETTKLAQIMQQAGALILDYYYNRKKLVTTIKADNTPVTQADIISNDFLIKQINILHPNIPIVSEENDSKSNLHAAANNCYFMLDPLDGTHSFIKKSTEFTINLALIKNNTPVFGIIYLPATKQIFFTYNKKTYKTNNFTGVLELQEQLRTTTNATNELVILSTNNEPEKSAVIKHLAKLNIKIKALVSVSSACKFCLIATGEADLYLRLIHIQAWDVAAGHALVKYAGGQILDLNNQNISYKFMTDFNMPYFKAM